VAVLLSIIVVTVSRAPGNSHDESRPTTPAARRVAQLLWARGVTVTSAEERNTTASNPDDGPSFTAGQQRAPACANTGILACPHNVRGDHDSKGRLAAGRRPRGRSSTAKRRRVFVPSDLCALDLDGNPVC
jgi:hypothetical protein